MACLAGTMQLRGAAVPGRSKVKRLKASDCTWRTGDSIRRNGACASLLPEVRCQRPPFRCAARIWSAANWSPLLLPGRPAGQAEPRPAARKNSIPQSTRRRQVACAKRRELAALHGPVVAAQPPTLSRTLSAIRCLASTPSPTEHQWQIRPKIRLPLRLLPIEAEFDGPDKTVLPTEKPGADSRLQLRRNIARTWAGHFDSRACPASTISQSHRLSPLSKGEQP